MQSTGKIQCIFEDRDLIQTNEPLTGAYWSMTKSVVDFHICDSNLANMHRAPPQCPVVRFGIHDWMRHGHCPWGPPSLVGHNRVIINNNGNNYNNNSRHSWNTYHMTGTILCVSYILIHLLFATTLFVSYCYQLQFQVRKLRLRGVKYQTQITQLVTFCCLELIASLYTRQCDDYFWDSIVSGNQWCRRECKEFIWYVWLSPFAVPLKVSRHC